MNLFESDGHEIMQTHFVAFEVDIMTIDEMSHA